MFPTNQLYLNKFHLHIYVHETWKMKYKNAYRPHSSHDNQFELKM